MLSFTRTGTLHIAPHVDVEVLPRHLAAGLRSLDASSVEVLGCNVSFTSGFFRPVSNWNILVPFGSGTLMVDSVARQVRYSVDCRQLVLAATIMVGLMSIFVLLSRIWQMLLAIPFMWLWLVEGNLAIGIPRFEAFLSRTIASTPPKRRPSTPSGLVGP